MQLTAQSQYRHASRHLTLHRQRNSQYEILDPLDRAGLDDSTLVPLAAGSEIAQGRDGMALHFLVLVEREEIDQRLQEARIDDGRFVGRVDGHVPDAGSGGKDQREVRGVQ